MTFLSELHNMSDMSDGRELEKMQAIFRLTPAEVAAEAGMSTATLRRAYRNEAPEGTRKQVAGALETLRRKLLTKLQSKTG